MATTDTWTPESCATLAEVTGKTLRPGGLALTGRLLELGGLAQGSRLLDAGCGMGATLAELAGRGPFEAVGVDCSTSMVAAAGRECPAATLVCAALEHLPFAAALFDGVICECVLSQTDFQRVLEEFRRVLRPGGALLVSDLHQREPADAADVPAGLLPGREGMRRVLRQAGFELECWEDRTPDLRRLAAQLVLAGGAEEDPCKNALQALPQHSCPGKKPGYHLLAARRSA